MQAVLVHNPDAGAGKPSAKRLMALLADAGLSPIYCHAKDEKLADVLARATGIVIAAGGDGTIGRVARRMTDRDIPVAILPLGTANNVARSLGITGTVEAIIEGWRGLDEKRLDLCVASGPWGERRFVEAVGIGALADATRQKIRDAKSLAKRIERGRDAFRKAVAKAKPVKIDISVDGRQIDGEVLLAEVMNIAFVGSRLKLAPMAKPADGHFDLIAVRVDERDTFLAWLENPEVEDAPVTVETGRCAIVGKNSAPLRIGDKLSDEKPAEVRVEIEEQQQAILVPHPEERGGSEGGADIHG